MSFKTSLKIIGTCSLALLGFGAYMNRDLIAGNIDDLSSLEQKIIPQNEIVIPPDSGNMTQRWKVLLDAGHGGPSSEYAQLGTPGEHASPENPNVKNPERVVNLRVTSAIKDRLQKDPRFQVTMTRTENKYVTLSRRAHMSNEQKVDAFLSIHSNAVANSKPQSHREAQKGFTPIFSYKAKSDLSLTRSPVMAGYIGSALVNAGFPAHGIGTSSDFVCNSSGHNFVSYWPKYGITSIWKGHKGLTVLTQNERPAVLLETHYMSSPTDVASFQTNESISRFADAIHKGLVAFLENPDTLHTSTGRNDLVDDIKHANAECKNSGVLLAKN